MKITVSVFFLCGVAVFNVFGVSPYDDSSAALFDVETEALALEGAASAGACGQLEIQIMGGTLNNIGDYDWWYGCSPTSAGMMMGFYDRNGYNGQSYENLVPGGVAETNTFNNPDAIVNDIIASSGHIDDFYIDGYEASGDDMDPPFHEFNCLADFMGTSQDSNDQSNGSTGFYSWTGSNNKLYASDIEYYGLEDSSGMYGIGEYVQYVGYDYTMLYNQNIEGYDGISGGFSWDDYKNEIDSNRVVMIHIEGHSMLGVGYDGENTTKVLDTWTSGPHDMTWGGSYDGKPHTGVTVLEVIPEPITPFFFLTCVTLSIVWRKMRALFYANDNES